MKVSINSGGKEVIGSGIFTTFDAEPPVISINRDSEAFNIKILFKEDSSLKPLINFKGEKDEKKNNVNVTIELSNFISTVFTGFIEPVGIGRFDNGDEIFIQLGFRKMGVGIMRHEVTYTVYLEEKKK